MTKRMLLIFSMLNCLMTLTAQSDLSRSLDADTDLFHGRWIAKRQDISYEIEFVREVYRYIDNHGNFRGNIEDVWGKLVIIENDKIIKETAPPGKYSSISSFEVISPYHIYFYYNDFDRGFHGTFDFIINKHAPKNAVLKLGKKRGATPRGVEYDIPDNLSFRKVE